MCWSCKRKGEGEREKWVSVSRQNQNKLRVWWGVVLLIAIWSKKRSNWKLLELQEFWGYLAFVLFDPNEERALLLFFHTHALLIVRVENYKKGVFSSVVSFVSLYFKKARKREVNERYGVACLSGWIWETCHKGEHSQVCYLVFFSSFFALSLDVLQ